MGSVVVQGAAGELQGLRERVKETAIHSKAPNTLRAYRADWKLFEAWCGGKGLGTLPASPDTVSMYLMEISDVLKVSSIRRRLASISQAHQMAGVENPAGANLVRMTVQGIARANGSAPHQKKPTYTRDLQSMVEALPDNPIGVRDRALLLLGFAGAFRRSELVALDVEDLEFVDEGMVACVRRSKTDQEGQGLKKGIYKGRNGLCPVNAVNAWLTAAGITSGAIFRYVDKGGHVHADRLSDRAVAETIKKRAKAVGLDPMLYSGHSLRAGCATVAAGAGAQDREIMKMTGHRSSAMVQRYVREASLFKGNVSGLLGL